MLASPHGYFRILNTKFANEVCRRFRASLQSLPPVNLHGDAHVEQYAVTGTGRGLTDFDDSASGPAVLDIVRFAVSLDLVAHALGWDDRSEDLIREFIRGYRDALSDPELEVPEPRVVTRVRSAFNYDTAAYFAYIDSISEPIDAKQQQEIAVALESYVTSIIKDDPSLGRDYFRITTTSRARVGVGSALAHKYVLRIRGASDAPDDDEILELKQVGDLRGIECLTESSRVDPMRLLVAQARIAYEPYRLVGQIRLGEPVFWVHAWAKSYQELKHDQFERFDELKEIAFDVGVQLGKGHPKFIAAPLDVQLRRQTLEFVGSHESAIIEVSHQLRAETVAGWKRAVLRYSEVQGRSHRP